MRYLHVEFVLCVIISYFLLVKTVNTICLTDEGTVPRLTVASYGVFEARSSQPVDHGTIPLLDIDGTPLNVSFFVIKVHKGKTIPESQTVTVQIHGSEGNGSCSLVPGSEDVFVVFADRGVKGSYYYTADHIVPATEEVIREVRTYACAKCGLPVKVSLPKRVKVQEGARLNLKCQTKGSLRPTIYWSKEGLPLLFDGRTRLVGRLGSTLQIKRIHQKDAGTYQCFASTAVANSSLASAQLLVTKAKYPAAIHGELCERQDYCLNKGRCYFLRTLGKKYCVCAKGFTGKQCVLGDTSVSVSKLEQSDGSLSGSEKLNKTFIVCTIVVGSILLATIIILTFCVVRLCHTQRKPSEKNDEKNLSEHLPILPDGHQTIVNVKRLSYVLNQQSASDFDGTRPSATMCFPGNLSLDRVREEEPATTTTTNSGPTHASWSGSRQSGSRPPAISKEQRRMNRLSAASDDVTSRCQSWISGNRLSMTSDQLSFSNDRPSMKPHPTSKSNLGAARLSNIASARDRFVAIPSAHDTEFRPMQDLAESADSGGTQYDHPAESQEADERAVTEASVEAADKDERQSDLEVNFESEADILGVEMSGDELNDGARGTSREFSELSIPTNDNRSMITTDSEGSTLSITEDQALLRRLSEYPFIDTNVFGRPGNIQESGSDLSWDESADIPSFAHPSLMYSGHS